VAPADSRISNPQSPIGDFQHPFALSLAIVPATNVIDKDDCKRIFEIADCRLRIANVRNLPCIRQVMSSMPTRSQVLQQRLVSHASAIVEACSKLPKTFQANHISRQLLRAGTAAAANYGEARGAESRADFIHKLRIVLKELNEAAVWIQLILKNSMLPAEKISGIASENEELGRIIAASIKTAGGFERA